MILNLLVLLLVILITLYLSTQGMLSAMLALATSIFSSILAMALLEPSQGIIGSWRPDYARGITFLLLYLVIFSITRFAADAAVPQNIKLSRLINRVTGGFIGFFTGLTVVGSLVIGIDMLPIGRAPLGFERFEPEGYMQAVDGDGKERPGELARARNIWLAPDRFVLALWNGASGRSLGGARAWSSVHPDLTVESYGYRSHINGSRRTLPADLVAVKQVWLSSEVALRDAQGRDHRPESGKRFVMVRSEIQKGGRDPQVSSDADGFLRITAPQVRLVTDKRRQYYPVGFMESGSQFVPWSLGTGLVVDDYFRGEAVADDWVFRIGDDEKPVWFEIKQLGRVEIQNIKDKPGELASNYAPREFEKDLCSLKVQFDPGANQKLKAGRVYLLKPEAVRGDISDSLLLQAHERNLANSKAIEDGSGGWTSTPKPGVPGRGLISTAISSGQQVRTDPDETPVIWSRIIPMLLLSQARPDGNQNLRVLPPYFEETVLPMWRDSPRGSLIVGFGNADENGNAEIKKILAGRKIVVITLETDRGFFVWVEENEFPKSTAQQYRVSPRATTNSPVIRIDLEEPQP